MPSPNLDDRSFDDIVEEAKKLIPQYCPQWTDFNVSDPGIAIIELMAWMTEMMIYRLNRVPEKNYIKFLELMGISLKASQPSKAWVIFNCAKVAKEEDLPHISAGTRLSTGESTNETVVFETVDSLNLTSTKIVKIVTRNREMYTDHKALLIEELAEGVPIFIGDQCAHHILYLGDSHLGAISNDRRLRIYVSIHSESDTGSNFEWECWDGKGWSIIIPVKDETLGFRKSGEILFESLPASEETVVDKTTSFWLRVRLTGMGCTSLPMFTATKRSFELKPDYSLVPDKGYVSTEAVPLLVDFSRAFFPFGKKPVQDTAFTIGSEVFSKNAAKILIEVTLSERYVPHGIQYLNELEVQWEYYSEKWRWELLGRTAVTGVIESKHRFTDQTDAFTHSGTIGFNCPDDIALFLIQDEENFWIRVRISKGDYGTEKISSPIINTLQISYEEKPQDFEYYLSYNYISYKDLINLIKEQKPFKPFEILPEEDPAFYLAFDSPFSNKLQRLYVRLAEVGGGVFSRIVWEYFAKKTWNELKLSKDNTNTFSQNGAIEFIAPADWTQEIMYEEKGYWLRARCESGSYKESPRLLGVYLNAVESIQAVSIRNEILGSSTREAYQTFNFTNSPIIPNPKILVKEAENPSAEEIARIKEVLKGDVVEEKNQEGDVIALWIRWHRVINLFNSRPESRHYTLDYYKACINFGDGKRGMIPPIGRDNIKCEVYYLGGGTRGNVGKNAISNLEKAYPYVESVRNPDAAIGGSEGETIEDAKLRGPWVLKHRYRAVTIEDFENLALEASGEVAKVKCFSEDGEIKLVILPEGDSGKLQPGAQLISEVKKYLDERRLITSSFSVMGPVYVDVKIEVEAVVKSQKVELIPEIKIKLEKELKKFFHPLRGGLTGDGCPMGRAVHISEIYNLLEKQEEVDYAKKIKLNDNPWLQKIEIGTMNYPYLKVVDIKVSG